MLFSEFTSGTKIMKPGVRTRTFNDVTAEPNTLFINFALSKLHHAQPICEIESSFK